MPFNTDKGLQIVTKKMLTTLESKVDPSHTALIVVDVQNDFCANGGAFGKDGWDLSMIQATVPKIVNFIQKAREVNLTIIYIQSIYYTENNWYLSDVFLERAKRKGIGSHIKYPLCEKESWGAEFYGGIKPLTGEIVVNKHRYCAFIETNLDLILRNKGIRTMIMSGVTTDCCVETTAKVGFMKDYYIVFPKDLTATFFYEAYTNTLKNIDLFYGDIVDSNYIIRCWQENG